jgi:hypothetical protein
VIDRQVVSRCEPPRTKETEQFSAAEAIQSFDRCCGAPIAIVTEFTGNTLARSASANRCRFGRARQIGRYLPVKDLAPDIYRQRLVIEGIPSAALTAPDIVRYLSSLSSVLDMTTLLSPLTHKSPLYGWAGWIHWETSGAHLYAWDGPKLFFSVDIYTCKRFDDRDAVDFTREFFSASHVEHRGF